MHGEEPIETVRELLERRDRGSSGTTAPAWGLYLHDVEYEG
ncbi:MAG: hypothetical protein ACOC2V_00320 [Alkalispirochaeta sp.]